MTHPMRATDEARIRADLAAVEAFGRRLNAALWTLIVGFMIMTAVGITLFAIAHGVPKQVAWMADPLLGATLITILQADAFLARFKIKATGWAIYVRVMAGVGTLVLNTWDSWVEQDRRRCGEVAADLRSQLAAIAGQAAEETRELERLNAARQAAEAQARADQAAADRARAELAAEVQRAAQEGGQGRGSAGGSRAGSGRGSAKAPTRGSGSGPAGGQVTVEQTAQVALAHRAKHHVLPTVAKLMELSGASESTAKRALRQLRDVTPIHALDPAREA